MNIKQQSSVLADSPQSFAAFVKETAASAGISFALGVLVAGGYYAATSEATPYRRQKLTIAYMVGSALGLVIPLVVDQKSN